MTGLAYVYVLAAALSSGPEWPQFRGPLGDGHATAQQVPTTWSETDNIAWKTEIPGRGWSSPVIGDGLVWLTTAVEKPIDPAKLDEIRKEKLAGNPLAKQMEIVGDVALYAIAVDLATGKRVRDVKLLDVTSPDPIHSLNSFASPTPILAGNRLACHFGTYGTVCLDTRTGEILWKTTLSNIHAVGPGSSPVLAGEILIIPCDGTESQYVAGVDLLTGKIVWKTPRPKMTGDNGDFHKSYSTPYLADLHGRQQAIIVGAQWVVSYDPASGQELWKFRHGEGFSNVPRPIVGHNKIYICTGYMKPQLVALQDRVQGEVGESDVAWRMQRQVPAMPSPIIAGNEIYMISDTGGIVTCMDAQSGDVVWQQRISGNYSASPLLADGKLYFCSREGVTTVLAPGREFTVLASNQLDGQLMASPAAIDGGLLLRTQSHLYRIGK